MTLASAPMMPGPDSVAMPTSAAPRFEMTEYTTSLRWSGAPLARNAPPTADVKPMPCRRPCNFKTRMIAENRLDNVRIKKNEMKVDETRTPKYKNRAVGQTSP